LGGYGDTIAAMAGSIAAIFFGKPEKTKKIGIEKANVIKYRPPPKVTRNHY
jgi:ADP-ribosylglycohydrolase